MIRPHTRCRRYWFPKCRHICYSLLHRHVVHPPPHSGFLPHHTLRVVLPAGDEQGLEQEKHSLRKEVTSLTERINVQANVAAAMEKECEALRSAVNIGWTGSLFVEASWYHCFIFTQQDIFGAGDHISKFSVHENVWSVVSFASWANHGNTKSCNMGRTQTGAPCRVSICRFCCGLAAHIQNRDVFEHQGSDTSIAVL